MNKQILFALLLITTTLSYGMKRSSNALVAYNDYTVNEVSKLLQNDLLPQFTAGIYSSNNYQPLSIKKNIRALSDTNKFFHDYYTQEKVKQTVIDLCVLHNNSNSKDIAHDLGCYKIHDKIERLTDIVRNKDQEFSQNDIVDPWYLAVTTTYNDYNVYQEPLNQPLWYIAIDYRQLEKTTIMLKDVKKLHFNYAYNLNPIVKITHYHNHARLLHDRQAFTSPYYMDPQQLLAIAQELLEKGILPDSREKDSQFTALLWSVNYTNKEFVRLLLKYGTDPCLKGYDKLRKIMVNAFDLEPEEGWLQNIIDEVNADKNNHNEQKKLCIKK